MRLILDALGNNVKPSGRDKWTARCPVHNDKDFAMSIKLLPDNRVIAVCHACGANGMQMVEALMLGSKGMDELNGGLDIDPNWIHPDRIATNVEDIIFIKLYDKEVAAGRTILWEDKKRHRISVARIAGFNEKYGSR